MTIKKQTKTTSMIIATILLAGIMGLTSQSAHAVPSSIDFEGLCTNTIIAPIVTADNSLTLKVGTTLVGATDGYVVTVGAAREAFQVGNADSGINVSADGLADDTPHNIDGTVYVEGGNCFYSDDVQGFNAGFNYYLSFANPVNTLSLDLYDYSDDGNFTPNDGPKCVGNSACDGEVATLTVYDDLTQTNIVGTATYTVDALNWFDGQVANLSVAPGASFISASITFSNIDRGTGIDNITFEEEPRQYREETAWADGTDFKGKNWATYIELDTDTDCPKTVDLLAGQFEDAGDVTVDCDGANLTITITMQNDWELLGSHLHVGSTVDEIPQKKGNPPPGKFEYKGDETVFQYTVVDPVGPVVIALHTEVQIEV